MSFDSPSSLSTLFVSLRTTSGFPHNGELLEIAVLHEDGRWLFESLVRPQWHTEWPDAAAKHGIKPADVQEAPTIDSLLPLIAPVLQGQRVVIFNAPVEACSPGLTRVLAGVAEIRCLMREFAPVYGEWNTRRGAYRWKGLATAAHHVGFNWPPGPRQARHECLATQAVWRYLLDTAQPAMAQSA
jgi:DNA polymerase III subunit epsilon